MDVRPAPRGVDALGHFGDDGREYVITDAFAPPRARSRGFRVPIPSGLASSSWVTGTTLDGRPDLFGGAARHVGPG
jgi:hypothetical protein